MARHVRKQDGTLTYMRYIELISVLSLKGQLPFVPAGAVHGAGSGLAPAVRIAILFGPLSQDRRGPEKGARAH
jgi:hypothetical protein